MFTLTGVSCFMTFDLTPHCSDQSRKIANFKIIIAQTRNYQFTMWIAFQPFGSSFECMWWLKFSNLRCLLCLFTFLMSITSWSFCFSSPCILKLSASTSASLALTSLYLSWVFLSDNSISFSSASYLSLILLQRSKKKFPLMSQTCMMEQLENLWRKQTASVPENPGANTLILVGQHQVFVNAC